MCTYQVRYNWESDNLLQQKRSISYKDYIWHNISNIKKKWVGFWGALCKGEKAGALADMVVFSLYVAHIISTVEGCNITTGNE